MSGSHAGQPPTEETVLLKAVTDLTKVVDALNTTLKEDYPKRQEIERNFISKDHSRKRVRQIAVGMVVAIVASYFATVGTVNYCFLNGVPEPGTRDICNVFPGYEASFDNNREFIASYTQLQNQISQNQKDIARLKKAAGVK